MTDPKAAAPEGIASGWQQELQRIVKGFNHEAMNGVICVPPGGLTGFPIWNAPAGRTWCARCRSLWLALFDLAERMPLAAPPGAEEPAPREVSHLHTLWLEFDQPDRFGLNEFWTERFREAYWCDVQEALRFMAQDPVSPSPAGGEKT